MKKYTLLLRNTSDSFANFTAHNGKNVTLLPREHTLIVVDAKHKGFYNFLLKSGVSISVIKEEEEVEKVKEVRVIEEVKEKAKEEEEDEKVKEVRVIEEAQEEVKKDSFDYEFYKSKSKPEIMSILDGLGIKYKSSYTKEKLIKLLEENHD